MTDSQSIKTIIRFFMRQQVRYKGRLFGMVFTHPFAILFQRFLPTLIIADILDRLSRHDYIDGQIWQSFGPSLVLAISLGAIGSVLIWRITVYFNWTLENKVVRDINRKVFEHLMQLSSSFHANHFGGALVSQTSKLANAYVRFTDTTVFNLFSLFWTLVFTSILLAGRAPLFVALLLLFTGIYVVCTLAFSKGLRRVNRIEADRSNEQTGHLADAITNVMAVKSFAQAQAEAARFAAISEKTRLAGDDSMRATLSRETLFSSIGTAINAVSLVIAIGSVVLFNANIAVVFLVVNYTGDILGRLWDFSLQALRNYNRAFGDAQSMVEILAIEPEVKDPERPEESRISKGQIAFKNMSFTHADSHQDDTLFSDLNLTIKASEKIGLVGHSGSGKTTLTKLLLRFCDIDKGEILIDGQNIANITQDELRQYVAYVPQEPLLFHRSIKENIGYGNPSASDKEIVEAARKAHALNFIEKLPDKLNTLVGERGVKLSGGQRQRIAIARAILKDAPILVLDEATSALDSESEKLIQSALWELMKGRTAIVIAHRLSTVQKMDRIIVLQDGQITEEGTHTELVKNNGTYAQLWNHQSGGFLED